MMARAEANTGEALLWFHQLRSAGGLRGRGRRGTVADDLRSAMARGLFNRYALAQEQPSGEPLAELAASTLAEKRKKGYPDTILYRTGLMLSLEQLKGEAEFVDDKTLDVTYGTSEQARLEMEWATEGDRKRGRPKRPGYELDEATEADMDRAAEDALDALFGAAGAE
jgi:hypothetical protein